MAHAAAAAEKHFTKKCGANDQGVVACYVLSRCRRL
jgi:hypothetical protein